MAGVSTNAIALVLVTLLSVLVTSVRSAANYDTAAARSYNSGWLPAKATWYGAPTGAGPMDNGTPISMLRWRRTFSCINYVRSASNSADLRMDLQAVLAASRT